MNSPAEATLSAPLGMTMLSNQRMPPSAGMTKRMSGRAGLELDHVARPGQAGGELAALQGVDVLVAGEAGHLARRHHVLQPVEGGVGGGEGGPAGVVAPGQHEQAHHLPHLRHHPHPAPEPGVEEVGEGAQVAPGEGGVVGDAGDPRLPRHVEAGAPVPGRAQQGGVDVDVVGDVLQGDLVEQAPLEELGRPPSRWGRRCRSRWACPRTGSARRPRPGRTGCRCSPRSSRRRCPSPAENRSTVPTWPSPVVSM